MIRLRPRQGRVVLKVGGREVLNMAVSHLVYAGPYTEGRFSERPLLDRGRIRAFALGPPPAQRMWLSGFGPGLEIRGAENAFQEADGIEVVWPELGRIRLRGFHAQRVDLRPKPGGVYFRLSGQVRGEVRRKGWPGAGSGIPFNKE